MGNIDLFTLENEFIKVSINRIGAELHSLVNKRTHTEHLWQGDANYWNGRAPVLFPIVGALKNNTIFIKRESYSIPKHGIIRRNATLKAKKLNGSTVRITFVSTDAYKDMYPYKCSFSIDFILKGHTLQLLHRVTNLDSEPMFFSLGAHPAFRCPPHKDESYEDYVLEFDTSETFVSGRINRDGLFVDTQDLIAKNSDTIPLRKNMFDKDALVFTNLKSRALSLKHTSGKTILSVSYPDFPHLGLWAKPGAPFVCIEPWIGYNDPVDTTQKIEDKPGMVRLDAEKTFEASYFIRLF